MQLGIFAKTFEGTSPATVLAAAARCGYTTVQYNMACSGLTPMPDHISDTQAHEVATAALSNDISISAVSGTYNMIHPDCDVREMGHVRLEVLASRCRAISANMITLCTGTRDAGDQWRRHPDNDSAEAWRDLLQSFETAIGIAERWNINLGVEPEMANVVSSAAKAEQLVRELGSERIKIVLDPANLFETATLQQQHRLISAATDKLGDRIAIAHAKDRASDGSFVATGKGTIDFDHFLGCLMAAGYGGPLVTHGLSAEEAPDVATFLRRKLLFAGLEAT